MRLLLKREWLELERRERELLAQIAKLERLVDYERERMDAERLRADRLNDALLQQNGLPPATNTGRAESASAREAHLTELQHQLNQIAEIYGEGVASLEDQGLELPKELKQLSDTMLDGLRKSE